jgi:hypothetical protein
MKRGRRFPKTQAFGPCELGASRRGYNEMLEIPEKIKKTPERNACLMTGK